MTYIYLHIPKAAGSTMRTILEGFFDEDRTFVVGDDIPGDEERFCDMPEDRRVGMQLVFGHINWGWHRVIPGEVRYVTMLREPFQRIQSLYHYIVRSPGHFLYDEAHDMGMVEFIESGIHCNTDNGMVRQLCGIDRFYNPDGERNPYDDSCIPYGHITHEHFEMAVDNLRKCWLVGTTDGFDTFLKVLEHRIGKSAGWYRIKNRTPHSQKKPLTCNDRIAIATYNRFDRELYRIAKELLNEAASGIR